MKKGKNGKEIIKEMEGGLKDLLMPKKHKHGHSKMMDALSKPLVSKRAR
jgi:hypothetical protein